ncbi:MAG: hypothetical protein SGJ21_13495 [Alphaproteobacteria bacterium]|nr:hypothetical protein [Alphaproteobacteria bacterium]
MFGLPKFGDGICLSRIADFYDALEIDTEALSRRSIVVTGTNGKGSTARFIASALEATGLRVGCFTSPHLFDVRERFLVGEEMISRADFDDYAGAVLRHNVALPDRDRMGAFEVLFLMAVLWFEREAPDAIVWEAGIGGRYDPVRTVRARVSALTSIELEHTELLGATEELIAYDKTDALAPGGTLVLSPGIPPALADRIARYASLSSKRAIRPADRVGGARNTLDGAVFAWRDEARDIPVQLRLIGRHQIDNAVTAAQTAACWLENDDPLRVDRLPPDSWPVLLGGLGQVRWPGRLERVASGPDLWIDVGHTPNAVDLVTAAFLDVVPRERTLIVFGVSASKDIRWIAAIVASRFDRFILTRARKSGADVSAYADIFDGLDATIEPDIVRAAGLARARASRDGLTVLAIGGLFLAAEFQHAWSGGDPDALAFL